MSLTELLGYAECDVLGQPLQNILVEEDREEATNALFGVSASGEHSGMGLSDNLRTIPLLLRSHRFDIPAFKGWSITIQALDGFHLLRELLSHPLFQHFLDRAFIGVRAVECDMQTGHHRMIYINEAAKKLQSPDPSEVKTLTSDDLRKISNFWEQGKEIQFMTTAHALVTHYYGIFSIKRNDGHINFNRYITCEAATPDQQRFVRLGFEWDITGMISAEMEEQANTSALSGLETPGDAGTDWLDIIPIPVLLLAEDGSIVYRNLLAAKQLSASSSMERNMLLDLVCPPWHVNVSSFLDCSLSSAHSSRHLRCNMLDARGTSFPAELIWRRIQHEHTIRHLVLVHNLSEYQQTARVIEKLAEHERCRFGQELHDFVGQNASAISIILSTLRMNKSIPVELRDAIQSAEDAARNILTKARHLSRGLLAHSSGLKGLVEALKDLAEEMEKLRDWECCVTACEMPAIRSDIAVAAYRIAREAAENALRYSGAAVLSFRLHQADQWLYLTVEDNGCGLPNDYEKRGSGMASMRQTAFAMGGCVTISTKPEGGVRLTCTVPINH